MDVLGVILLVAVSTSAWEYTDEELSSFPRLFHLDDYERCLAKKDGLYCLGSFDLSPKVQPHPIYELLKAYSDESHRHFNRTRIHRGYCVSSRCSQVSGPNASQRFEQCANEWVHPRTLRASINTLHYCHTHADRHTERFTTTGEYIFLQCICAIVVINIIGTIYDIYGGEKHKKKNSLLTAFSIPANWQKFAVVKEHEDPHLAALSPLDGIRATSMIMTTFVHANILHYAVHIINPDYLERQTQRFDGVMSFDGTSLMQILLMMSCFLTSYNLLTYSRKQELNLTMLPLHVIKRVIRMAPVTLLIVAFGATWWARTRDGALAPVTIGASSKTCQSKFWSHVFFVNNIVNPTASCLISTWTIPVDLHMYIVACTLTMIMCRRRQAALKLYSILFLASSVMVAIIAYIKEYKSIIFINTPEEIRNGFRDSPSFTEFYISSWGALPSCFLGLLLAHIQIELEERQIKLSDHKWFVYLHYCSYPVFMLWALKGFYAHNNRTRIFYAIYILLDRPLHCILACITMLGLAHVDGPLRRLYRWSGWVRMSRLSLAVMTLHWCVNMAISARPAAYAISPLDMAVDWLSTCVITYTLAVPITVLVEIPMQRFLRQLLI